MKKLLLLPLLAVLSGCVAQTSIRRITADPLRYQNRRVAVHGVVTNAVGAFVAGLYQVDDGTGRIYVLSNGGVPPKGTRVALSGYVTPGVTVFGQSFGTTIRERQRRVRY